MNDYFSTVREKLGDACEARRHLPWYHRIRLAAPHGLVVLVATLVIAAPAVGAATGWFSFGAPNATPSIPTNSTFGTVHNGRSMLLPIRVADPQGGPPWGLRLVRTDTGNTCLQLGRVEGGQLGSLGIDGAWNDDHQFHATSPNATYADTCGSTDATGYGYLNAGLFDEEASANLPTDGSVQRPQSHGCKSHGVGGPPSWPYCPFGSGRVIFYGLLGPDATAITYRTVNGTSATERTVGRVGAYLLVFTRDRASCAAYSHDQTGTISCSGIHYAGVSPDGLGAIAEVSYRHGHSCTVDSVERALDPGRPACPPLGWVSPRHAVTETEVAAPIRVHVLPVGTYACPRNGARLPNECNEPIVRFTHGRMVKLSLSHVIPVEFSFKARRAVRAANSAYTWIMQPLHGSAGCSGGVGGGTGQVKIRAGQILRYSTFLSVQCHGTYLLTVSYTPSAQPGANNGGGVLPLANGSVTVGNASFTIR